MLQVDFILHMFYSCLLYYILYLFPVKNPAILAFIVGLGKEFYDLIFKGYFNFDDLVFNMIGITLAYIIQHDFRIYRHNYS